MSIHIDRLEKEAAYSFWKWMIREAKPDVVHAEDAIECHGLADSNGFVPVLKLSELIERWYDLYMTNQT